jgi:hypothetical protein
MRRIASGTVDQYVYFRSTAGATSFSVYRSRNGAAWAAMTTPTVTEGDATNAPGVYQLLLDEDMTIGAGNVTEHMAFYVTAAGMTPVFLEVELFIANVSHMNMTTVNGTGVSGDLWRGA